MTWRRSVLREIPGRRPRAGWRKAPARLALTALLAGCGSSEPPVSRNDSAGVQDSAAGTPAIAAPASQLDPASVSATGPDSAWITTVSYVGHGLMLSIGGVQALQLGCVRESREMIVDVPAFSSIGSEERLSLGIDSEPFIFVAQVTPPPPAGVHATRSIDEEVLTALQSAGTISAFYGAQSSGPHPAPDSSLLRNFISGCRRALDP